MKYRPHEYQRFAIDYTEQPSLGLLLAKAFIMQKARQTNHNPSSVLSYGYMLLDSLADALPGSHAYCRAFHITGVEDLLQRFHRRSFCIGIELTFIFEECSDDFLTCSYHPIRRHMGVCRRLCGQWHYGDKAFRAARV